VRTERDRVRVRLRMSARVLANVLDSIASGDYGSYSEEVTAYVKARDRVYKARDLAWRWGLDDLSIEADAILGAAHLRKESAHAAARGVRDEQRRAETARLDDEIRGSRRDLPKDAGELWTPRSDGETPPDCY
jgi:hypothetical protein